MGADVATHGRSFRCSFEQFYFMLTLGADFALQIYKHATLFFSRSTPSLPTVIPAMDHIDDVLTNQSLDNATFSPAIRAACTLSKKTLNRYYNKTDHSENYRIAMGMSFTHSVAVFPPLRCFSVLHPAYKLEYFRARDWEQDWIETAESMVREEFARSYGDMEVGDNYEDVLALMDTSSSSKKVCRCYHVSLSYLLIYYKGKRDEPNIFDSLPALRTTSRPIVRDEIDRYLATPVDSNVTDAMHWWHDRQTQFPRLSRMALDYLSIPGMYSL
jgi:hypothetical protein